MSLNVLIDNSSKSEIKSGKIGNVFTPFIQKLIIEYQKSLLPKFKSNTPKIHVDEIASKVAKFYERIRKITDWKEDNLLRRSAIERILKRSLFGEFSKLVFLFRTDVDKVAGSLVEELIRGGHLPNDEIPYEIIPKVQSIIDKYFYLLKNAPFSKGVDTFKIKKKMNFYEWVLSIAACEIEEVVSPPIRENALILAMTETMSERIEVISVDLVSKEEKYLQTFIAVHRTLFDLDEPIITYNLIKLKYPQWTANEGIFVGQFTKNIFAVLENLDKDLHYPLSQEFFNLCEKYDTIFTVFNDVLDFFKNEPHKIAPNLENSENLNVLTKKFYQERLASLKSRIFRLAVFSTLSVFVTNWVTFFIVEVPLARLFYEGFNLLAAGVDFLLPSTVMFILVAIIKPPSESNMQKVISLTKNFVYENREKESFETKPKKEINKISLFLIILLYVIACAGVFGLIARVFYLAMIPITSVILDTIQIALNIFAALVVRNKARELTVEEKSSFWEFLLDIISLPIAEIGSWIATKWREYNIVSVFFNVIVETPFINFVQFIESWRDFLKERKAEIH